MTIIKYDKEKISNSQTNIDHLKKDYLKQLKSFKDSINQFSNYWIGNDATAFFDNFKKDILEYEKIVNKIDIYQNYLNLCSNNLTNVAKITTEEQL